jgi:hypothetical protein
MRIGDRREVPVRVIAVPEQPATCAGGPRDGPLVAVVDERGGVGSRTGPGRVPPGQVPGIVVGHGHALAPGTDLGDVVQVVVDVDYVCAFPGDGGRRPDHVGIGCSGIPARRRSSLSGRTAIST